MNQVKKKIEEITKKKKLEKTPILNKINSSLRNLKTIVRIINYELTKLNSV